MNTDCNIITELFTGMMSTGMKLDLSRITNLMDLLNNPQDQLKIVHVAGTNGKGSTCALTASILENAGYRVGKYTSPPLVEFNEHISINGETIKNSDIQRISETILRPKIELMLSNGLEPPTFFEITTALGFYYFYEQHCDVVILETGLGGRLDATNIIKSPLCSVITSISYDHTKVLGSTLSEIASEKAGIIKPGCPVVSYPQPDEVLNVLRKACSEKQSKLTVVDPQALDSKGFINNYEVFDFEEYKALQNSLLGEHQLLNAAVSIKAVEALKEQGLHIPPEAIYKGLKCAKNMGRFEVLGHNPDFVIDGAHNPDGMEHLKKALLHYYKNKEIILVIGILSRKDYKTMAGIIAPLAAKCIISEPIDIDAMPCEELAEYFVPLCKNVIVEKDAVKAVQLALDSADKDSLICCCGSLYFIGAVRQYYLGQK